jgi:hypothetical protein
MKPLVTFIATAHNEDSCRCPFVDSMLAQTCPGWNAIVWNNGKPDPEGIFDTQDYGDKRIQFKYSDIDTGNWGTVNRQQAIMATSAES